MQGNTHGGEAPQARDDRRPLGEQRILIPFDLTTLIGPEEGATQEPPPGKRGRRRPAAQGDTATNPAAQEERVDTATPDRLKRAAAYLDGFAPAVSGEGGHDQTFDAACALIKGFDLSIAEARPIFGRYCDRCDPPWSEAEREHKLADADKKADKKPRGYLYDDDGIPRPWQDGHPGVNGHAAGANGDVATINPREAKDALSEIEGMEEDPHRLARIVISTYDSHAGRLIHYWNEEFWEWRDARYSVIPREEIKAEVACLIHNEFVRIYSLEAARWKRSSEKKSKPKLRAASSRLIGDVIQALKSLTVLFVADIPSQPAWLTPGHEWAATDMLPVNNALIHLPSYAKQLPYSIAATPQFFNSYSLSYEVDSIDDIGEPTEWLKFLRQLWPSSPQSIELLQEWFGYMLTADTSHQKILMLIGPKRSGKGTIARILTQVVGEANVVNPTLGSLTTQFGLHPLFGKPVAIITDARISNRQDRYLIVERLLSISGEDTQTIDRKHRDPITVRLPTRFMIVSNEVPNLKDPSGAFSSRMLYLELRRSFIGQEDHGLYDRLAGELPQIFAWSVAGWKRLKQHDRFTQPTAAQELASEMDSVSSRIRTFIRELCILEQDNPECKVAVDVLYGRWKLWNYERELKPSDKDSFGRQLRSAFRFIERSRFRLNGDLVYFYKGIRLVSPPKDDDDDAIEDKSKYEVNDAF